MRRKLLGVMAGTGLMVAVAVPIFSGGGTALASAGCQDFGHATRDGAPWGQETKSQNENGDPGIIASNNEGAKAALC